MIYIALVTIGLCLLVTAWIQRKPKQSYLQEFSRTVFVDNMTSNDQAVDLRSLTDRTFAERMVLRWHNLQKQIGRLAVIKVSLFIFVVAFIALEINQSFFRGNPIFVVVILEVFALIWGYLWLQQREIKMFEETFPDALNMLASAVSAGESIMHAIMYVGRSLDGDVGNEFKVMGERLQLGETPDEVFRKSCERFPYPSFQFFVITLRANMHRGGQLKEVISRLTRLMFDARAVEKKKFALTAEARISAKIVASIPFLFLLFMQYMSPDNYEYVMFHPDGRPILYYMLTSEAIGMLIIWMLMRRVR
ncbi:type II secretion system F family protein [Vibrio maerlii]|uniref:type II secretion system F family protein n=1 Tax=Vibrio maerlii TaxID=2231648 RepID=UPI000E3BF999|nr:type II secretion system F family protein [Vibrio maerlii]